MMVPTCNSDIRKLFFYSDMQSMSVAVFSEDLEPKYTLDYHTGLVLRE